MAHDHSPGAGASNPRLGTAIALTLAFVVGEAVAGYFAQSLALMSDAGHNFTDALALILAWYARRVARQPAGPKRTFGSHRAGILAALANALTLVAIGAIILWEAAQRLFHPPPVRSGPMIGVALAAVVLNSLISLWLRSGAKHDLNLRSAYLHMLGDAVSALGVVAAGLFVAATGNAIADPLISLAIGGFIIWSSWEVVGESLNVLMEAAPKGLDTEALQRAIEAVPGVLKVHDLHAWSLASDLPSFSCHIVVADGDSARGDEILRAVAAMVRRDFGIAHTTIQVEVERHEHEEPHCTLGAVDGTHRGHAATGMLDPAAPDPLP